MVHVVSLQHLNNKSIMLFTIMYNAALGLLFVRLSKLSYRLVRLTQYFHKQLCLSGFSSEFIVTITNIWDDDVKYVMVFNN